ncbi:MAG: DedA family protein [Gemmatimonadota bacterium]
MTEIAALFGLTSEPGVATIYLLLALGAAVENVVPPVPADTFVVLGGVLASRGILKAEWVFALTWAANLTSAAAVYGLGRRYGERFFSGRVGAWLLSPDQLHHVHRFFGRWGVPALLLTRFLPGLRAVVPAFAGVSRLRATIVLPALGIASAAWYGGLVWVGTVAGDNLPAFLEALGKVNRGLLIVALLVFVVGVLWWRRSRGSPAERGDGDPGA